MFLLLTIIVTVETIGSAQTISDTLRRRGFVGAVVEASTDKQGVLVKSVQSSSTASALGLNPGDLIVAINGVPITNITIYAKAIRAWRENQVVEVIVLRNGSQLTKKAEVVAFPKEQIEGAEIHYGSLLADNGYPLRTIIAKPKNKGGKLPAILTRRTTNPDFTNSCRTFLHPTKTLGKGNSTEAHESHWVNRCLDSSLIIS